MDIKFFKRIFVIATPFVIAGLICTVLILSHDKLWRRKPLVYTYPCVVVEADNHGCQTKIEMRRLVAEAPS